MNKTGLLLDEHFADHDPGDFHPESPARVRAILDRFAAEHLAETCNRIEKRAAIDDEILLCHTAGYLKTVVDEIDGSSGSLSTGDTDFGPLSLPVARNAVGGVLNAVDAVMKGELDNAFAVVRPPGHHASQDVGMGFCIFNNAAIAARYAQKAHGAERVAIIDWDVHHGNGTQDIFYEDGSVFYFSTHQHPWYPGTGMYTETGKGAGKKTTLNAPLPAGTGMEVIGDVFRRDFGKAMKDFKPDFVIISAGFDSRKNDPLGDFTLTDDDFVSLTKVLLELAGEYANGRLVSVLEGGYNIDGLAKGAAAHLKALLGE